MRRSTTGTLLVLGAAAGFGTIGIFGEFAIATGLPLSTLLPVRFCLATVAVLVMVLLHGWSLPTTRREWLVTLTLGCVYTAMTIAFFTSLRYLTAGLATIVLYTYPTLVVVLGVVVLRESIGARLVTGLVCSLAGIGFVVGVGGTETTTAEFAPLGVGLALAAAACYAVYTAGSRRVIGTLSPRPLMIGVLVGTTISMLAYGLLAGGLAVPVNGREWAITAGLAVIGTVLPLVLFYEGVKRLPASRVGIISTAEPVVTVGLGVALLEEPLTWNLLVGGSLVLLGVTLVQGNRPDELSPGETPDTAEGEL